MALTARGENPCPIGLEKWAHCPKCYFNKDGKCEFEQIAKEHEDPPENVWGDVDIDFRDSCSVCGQWVRPKGRGSHRRKHKGVSVTYGYPPDTTSVTLYLIGYTPPENVVGYVDV